MCPVICLPILKSAPTLSIGKSAAICKNWENTENFCEQVLRHFLIKLKYTYLKYSTKYINMSENIWRQQKLN